RRGRGADGDGSDEDGTEPARPARRQGGQGAGRRRRVRRGRCRVADPGGNMKTLTALAALLLLTGCQATFWAQPPMPGGGCDPAAQGRWVSPAGEDADEERMRLTLDASCRLVAEKFRGGQTTHLSDTTRVRMARLGGQPYAWLDANTLLAYEGVAHRTRGSDVMVFRYRIE